METLPIHNIIIRVLTFFCFVSIAYCIAGIYFEGINFRGMTVRKVIAAFLQHAFVKFVGINVCSIYVHADIFTLEIYRYLNLIAGT